jgi:probable rRNA maturation factor
MSFTVEIADEAQAAGGHARLETAVRMILQDAGIREAEISIAVVDDGQMQALNRQYLDHDYPTDVLSFVLEHESERSRLEGQIIVSWQYAAREAPQYGWPADDELLLYVIHGCLHLIGHDDTTEQAQGEMRLAEAKYLRALAVALPRGGKP